MSAIVLVRLFDTTVIVSTRRTHDWGNFPSFVEKTLCMNGVICSLWMTFPPPLCPQYPTSSSCLDFAQTTFDCSTGPVCGNPAQNGRFLSHLYFAHPISIFITPY